MGKPADPTIRLRCVHCQSTETPLWRAGPDGPKTLCNACGVRYKKGKLVLYKDPDGNLTAVKRDDAAPFHVPPAPKKASKKANASPLMAQQPSSPQPLKPVQNDAKKAVRKVPSEGAIANAAVAKKPKSRSRRTNAGQLPGRYAAKSLPESMMQWRSPAGSPYSSPSSPADSPRLSDSCPGLLNSPAFKMDQPSLYQFNDPEDESMFPDVACLGIDSGGDSDNVTLLPMPADPSSAEQFSFAFAELGRDATAFDVDVPDRVEALRGLVLDRTRKVSRTYDNAVLALCRLCDQRRLRAKSAPMGLEWTNEDYRMFIRVFAQEQNVGLVLNAEEWKSQKLGWSLFAPSGSDKTVGVMLSEKTAYSSAVENFRALMDSTELVGFAEACMVELLAEDVVMALRKQETPDLGQGAAFRRGSESFPNKPIAVPG